MPSVECLHFPMNVSRIQTALLQMNWGLNPLFDTFDCQVHFFEGTGLAEQLRMRKPFCCYRFQGWKDRKKEATRNSSCVCLSICFNGVLIIFLKYVLTWSYNISQNSCKTSLHILTCFQHLPPKHRKIWNAHRHGSHRKVAWTLGWQDQLAYQRGAWVKWVGEVWSFSFWSETQCDCSIHVICVSHCFTCYIYICLVIFSCLYSYPRQGSEPLGLKVISRQVDGEFISRSTVQSSLVFSCRTTDSTRRFNRGNTLQGTNISSQNGTFEDEFPNFPRWDMLIPWRGTVFLGIFGMPCR